jgi:putative Mn2+ efflux pump MntP
MTKYDLYFYSLIGGIVLIMLGAFYKIQHHPGGSDILATGLLISLYWFFMGLAGLFRSNTLSPGQRVLWLAGFLLFTWPAGLLWYFREIKPLREKNNKDQDNPE